MPTHASQTLLDAAPPPARRRPTASPPQRVGAFEVGGVLGRGAMGTVYAGRHAELGYPVAIKFLHEALLSHAESVERFLGEARAVTRIDSPGVARVLDVGRDARAAWLVMELLEGESLRDRLDREGACSIERAVELAAQLGHALAAAHAAGIVHRDLKPANVVIVPDAAAHFGERLKLVDFGVAKFLDASALVQTAAGALLGTPSYMAPEQCRGELVDGRADVYALGCVLFELIAGEPPFRGPLGEVLRAHIEDDAPPLEPIAPGMSPDIAALVARMLRKRAADRPQSMAEVLAGLGSAAPVAAAPRPPRGARRRAALAVTVVAGPGSLAHGGGIAPPRRVARGTDADAMAVEAGCADTIALARPARPVSELESAETGAWRRARGGPRAWTRWLRPRWETVALASAVSLSALWLSGAFG